MNVSQPITPDMDLRARAARVDLTDLGVAELFASLWHAVRNGSMTQQVWDRQSPAMRATVVDKSGLTLDLIGLEGYRVEVFDTMPDTMPPKTRRFIVGKSTGWRPCHLEISRRSARGGGPARESYAKVTRLERVR